MKRLYCLMAPSAALAKPYLELKVSFCITLNGKDSHNHIVHHRPVYKYKHQILTCVCCCIHHFTVHNENLCIGDIIVIGSCQKPIWKTMCRREQNANSITWLTDHISSILYHTNINTYRHKFIIMHIVLFFE